MLLGCCLLLLAGCETTSMGGSMIRSGESRAVALATEGNAAEAASAYIGLATSAAGAERDSEHPLGQAVVEHVTRRRSEHASRVVGQVGGRFEADRARLLDTVGRAARSGLEGYERSAEARRMADSVQQALAGTAGVRAAAADGAAAC